MTAPMVADILATGHELADLYAEAVRDLSRHWPDADGYCLACPDEPYPCPEEWITLRAIAGIEARWRRAGRELAAIQQTPAAAVAAGEEGQEP